jgi:hypothetical protein
VRPMRHTLIGIGWRADLARMVWSAAFASKHGRDLQYADGVVMELNRQLEEEENPSKRPVACCEAVRRIETADKFDGYACPIHGTQWVPELQGLEKKEKTWEEK